MASSASDVHATANDSPEATAAPERTDPGASASQRGIRAPLVGLTTYRQRAKWNAWDTEATLLPAEYSETLDAAGGIPVLLPPPAWGSRVADGALISRYLDAIDGLILTGGADVDPARYDASPDPTTSAQPHRDALDFALLAGAVERGMPVLGICRGMQVLNVALGGTLHQNIPDVLGHSDYRPAPGVYGEAHVATAPGSLARACLGESTTAPCHHHQSVDRVGQGLIVTGRTADGTIEVLEPGEDWSGGWLFAVQWHPEHNHEDLRVMHSLVTAAREFAASR